LFIRFTILTRTCNGPFCNRLPYTCTMLHCVFWVDKGNDKQTCLTIMAFTTLNMISSVWLYLTLLLPYPIQHWFSVPWQLVLDIMLEDMLKFSFYPCSCFFCFSFHILTNCKFKHVTSTYYYNWYLVFQFTFNITTFIGLLTFSVCFCI